MPSTFHVDIPADVPHSVEQEYSKNYLAITKNSGRLMLFACDQKMEHLNNDFYGTNIHPDALSPEHIFSIAQQGTIGALATHLGLIARYGRRYHDIDYIVKLNGKTNLIAPEQQDPFSQQLWSVYDVMTFKKSSGLKVRGVGYTVYLGSEYEQEMLSQAAEIIYEAHQYGLIAIIWIYPRGKALRDDQDPQLVAGAAGVAVSLGADFVKLKAPKHMADLARAVSAAGTTKVICSGGSTIEPQMFLHNLYEQLHQGKTAGAATGRNIFQKSLPEALAFTRAISALIFDNYTVEDALALYQGKK